MHVFSIILTDILFYIFCFLQKKTDLPSELLLDGRSIVLYVEILFLRDLQCKYAIAVFKRVSLAVVIQRFACGK